MVGIYELRETRRQASLGDEVLNLACLGAENGDGKDTGHVSGDHSSYSQEFG